jgi:hypothetical protein
MRCYLIIRTLEMWGYQNEIIKLGANTLWLLHNRKWRFGHGVRHTGRSPWQCKDQSCKAVHISQGIPRTDSIYQLPNKDLCSKSNCSEFCFSGSSRLTLPQLQWFLSLTLTLMTLIDLKLEEHLFCKPSLHLGLSDVFLWLDSGRPQSNAVFSWTHYWRCHYNYLTMLSLWIGSLRTSILLSTFHLSFNFYLCGLSVPMLYCIICGCHHLYGLFNLPTVAIEFLWAEFCVLSACPWLWAISRLIAQDVWGSPCLFPAPDMDSVIVQEGLIPLVENSVEESRSRC